MHAKSRHAIDGVKGMCYAERKIIEGLNEIIRGVKSSEVKSAFDIHLQETEVQVERLIQVFELLEEAACAKTCSAIDGILVEGQKIVEQFKDTKTLDAGVLAAAQAVEQYEILPNVSLVSRAKQLGSAQLLEQTLAEETKIDQLLTQLADANVKKRGKKARPVNLPPLPWLIRAQTRSRSPFGDQIVSCHV